MASVGFCPVAAAVMVVLFFVMVKLLSSLFGPGVLLAGLFAGFGFLPVYLYAFSQSMCTFPVLRFGGAFLLMVVSVCMTHRIGLFGMCLVQVRIFLLFTLKVIFVGVQRVS